ncbi:MAG: hypothetical protein ACREL6_05990 [Gemmatimonadales bacterium]
MPEQRFRRVRGWVLPILIVAPIGAACGERERITAPDPGDGVGPVVTITQPRGDTTVAGGPGVFVAGFVLDKDGIDTLYVDVVNGNQNFSPLTFDKDSVRFDLPVSTSGSASGDTITVIVFAVDEAGNRGAPAGRQLFIQ